VRIASDGDRRFESLPPAESHVGTVVDADRRKGVLCSAGGEALFIHQDACWSLGGRSTFASAMRSTRRPGCLSRTIYPQRDLQGPSRGQGGRAQPFAGGEVSDGRYVTFRWAVPRPPGTSSNETRGEALRRSSRTGSTLAPILIRQRPRQHDRNTPVPSGKSRSIMMSGSTRLKAEP
jgi:hypothetical protein